MTDLRNLVLLCLVACSGLSAAGQKQVRLTEAVLAGSWQLQTMTMDGFYWDFPSDSMELSDDMRMKIRPGRKLEDWIAELKVSLAGFKNSPLRFLPGATYTQQFIDGEVRGSYRLTMQNSAQWLLLIPAGAPGKASRQQVSLSNGRLHLVTRQNDTIVMDLFYEREVNFPAR